MKSKEEKLLKQLDKLLARFEKKGVEVPPIGCPPVGGEDLDMPIFCPFNFDALGIKPTSTPLWASPFTLRFF